MTKLVTLFVSICTFAGLAFGQAPAEPAATPAKAPSVSETLKQIEHDWVDATKAGDTDKLAQILGDDWVALGYAGAARQTKKGYLAVVKSGGVKLESFEFGPMDVKVLGSVGRPGQRHREKHHRGERQQREISVAGRLCEA